MREKLEVVLCRVGGGRKNEKYESLRFTAVRGRVECRPCYLCFGASRHISDEIIVIGLQYQDILGKLASSSFSVFSFTTESVGFCRSTERDGYGFRFKIGRRRSPPNSGTPR